MIHMLDYNDTSFTNPVNFIILWILFLIILVVYIPGRREDKEKILASKTEEQLVKYRAYMDQLGYSPKEAEELLNAEFGWSSDNKQNLKTLKRLNRELKSSIQYARKGQ